MLAILFNDKYKYKLLSKKNVDCWKLLTFFYLPFNTKNKLELRFSIHYSFFIKLDIKETSGQSIISDTLFVLEKFTGGIIGMSFSSSTNLYCKMNAWIKFSDSILAIFRVSSITYVVFKVIFLLM